MVVDSQIEVRTILSIMKTLREGGLGFTVLQSPGVHDAASEGEEEWAGLFPLSFDEITSRAGTYQGTVLFQVSVFSRFGLTRSDKNTQRPWAMAGAVRELLDQEAIEVKDYDIAGATLITCMQVQRADAVYIPAREGGRGARPGGRAGLVGEAEAPTNTHGVALTYTGILRIP